MKFNNGEHMDTFDDYLNSAVLRTWGFDTHTLK
jgi:hypothetical protein